MISSINTACLVAECRLQRSSGRRKLGIVSLGREMAHWLACHSVMQASGVSLLSPLRPCLSSSSQAGRYSPQHPLWIHPSVDQWLFLVVIGITTPPATGGCGAREAPDIAADAMEPPTTSRSSTPGAGSGPRACRACAASKAKCVFLPASVVSDKCRRSVQPPQMCPT